MDIENFGKLRLIAVDGVDDDVSIDLRPDVGKLWVVLTAIGYHNDTVSNSRDLTWRIYDGTNTLSFQILTNQSTSKRMPIAIDTNEAGPLFMHPLILSRDVYAQFSVEALTAGDNVFIRALVIEYSGVG